MNTHEIELIIYNLGASKVYKGTRDLVYAVQLVLEDEERLYAVTKELYPAVAAHFNTEWKRAVRNMQTVVNVCWSRNRAGMCKLAGIQLLAPPSVGEFIAMLAAYIQRQGRG